jgi:anaerobic magnesium-protoporphyrin IX monomethyl ester cyclase
MRVLLIDFNPFMGATTPISLGYLAATLRAGGHDAMVVALGSDSRFSPAGLARRLGELAPDLVGFGAYQRNMLHVRAIAGLVKDVLSSSRVILGGPQGLFLPDEALTVMPEVDFLARGEGELALKATVSSIEAGTAGIRPIPGVTSRLSSGDLVTGEVEPAPNDLDAYPSPWLEGILDPADWDEAIMLTSRGCPHHCLFCLTPAIFGDNVRCHSSERVLDEIELVARRGSGRLWFADPNFCASTERVVALLEGVLQRGLDVRMWIEIRAEMATPEVLGLMRRAGVDRVAMGLESASPAVYPSLLKGLDPERIGAAARAALASGIDVELFSQYALPNETLNDALLTLRFVQDSGVAVRGNSNAQQMQLYHGSDITKRYHEHGIKPLRDDLPPYLALGTEFETEWMARSEIARVRSAWQAASEDGGKRIVS